MRGLTNAVDVHEGDAAVRTIAWCVEGVQGGVRGVRDVGGMLEVLKL